MTAPIHHLAKDAVTHTHRLKPIPGAGINAPRLEPTPENCPINVAAWCRFLDFQPDGVDNLPEIMGAVGRYCLAIKRSRPPRWLTLVGKSGRGKTHLGSRVWLYASRLLHEAFSDCEFLEQPIVWPQHVERLRAGTGYGLHDDLATWPVLFLDDILSENPSPFSLEKLYDLSLARERKWTIITSNLSLHQIARIEPRISDRMVRDGSVAVEIKREVSFANAQRRQQ